MNKERVRAHIRIMGPAEAAEFVSKVNSDGSTNKYYVENADGKVRADARSLLGVIYASAEFRDSMYFVNDSDDGRLPSFIDSYRVVGS